MTLALHWFRTDLRVDDNLALAAAQSEGSVAAIYIATPRQWQVHDDATIKLDYWRRNLQQLEGALQRTFGRDCRAAKLVRDDRQVRFLITNAASASKVAEWLGTGLSYADALTRLQKGAA